MGKRLRRASAAGGPGGSGVLPGRDVQLLAAHWRIEKAVDLLSFCVSHIVEATFHG